MLTVLQIIIKKEYMQSSKKYLENKQKNKSQNFLKMDILKMSKNENMQQRILKKVSCD